MLRARVPPAEDYQLLMQLSEYFGKDKYFVVTSNCDMLHVQAGTDPTHIEEIHGIAGNTPM